MCFAEMSDESGRESNGEEGERMDQDETWVQENSRLSRASEAATELGERQSAYNTRGDRHKYCR